MCVILSVDGSAKFEFSAVCGPIGLKLGWVMGTGPAYLATRWRPYQPPGGAPGGFSQLYVGQLGCCSGLGIAVIVAPSSGRFAVEGDCSAPNIGQEHCGTKFNFCGDMQASNASDWWETKFNLCRDLRASNASDWRETKFNLCRDLRASNASD